MRLIIKKKTENRGNFFTILLVFANAIFIAACSGGAAPSPLPAPVPSTATSEPTTVPTAVPTVTPTTVTLTATPPRPPTNTPRPTAQIYFEWDPAAVRPSDADDVAAIVSDIIRKEGLVSGYGNEQGITVEYDPTLIEVEEIQELLGRIGHPVQMEHE